MPSNLISKVVEVECPKEELLRVVYTPEIWQEISPVKRINIEFTAPNVFYSEIYDEVDLIKIPIEMSGELVMIDKGEVTGKGNLIELNVRNNKDVEKLEARLRIKSLGPNLSKVGVFIHTFKLTSDFLNLLGGASDLILRNKLAAILRNLQKYYKNRM
jgi:hypothetical protein